MATYHHDLNVYISLVDRLKALEKFADKIDEAIETADKATNYLFNPVNAFQLVNRYKNGWLKLHEHVYADNGQGICLSYIITLLNYYAITMGS